MKNQRLESVKRIGTGLSFILFPIIFIFAFAVHPDLLNLSIVHDINARVADFHHNALLYFGHVLMLLSLPLVIVVTLKLMNLLKERGAWLGFIGCVLAVFGVIFLAADKAALCMIPSAFDTLTEAQFAQLLPGLEAMFSFKGWLVLLWLLFLLPIGIAVQGVGLLVSRAISRWQSIPIIIGALLIINPDIDLIGLIGSITFATGFIPLGIQIIRSRT
jgi:hypothetical protein